MPPHHLPPILQRIVPSHHVYNLKQGVGAGRRGIVWVKQVVLSPRRLALPFVNGRCG